MRSVVSHVSRGAVWADWDLTGNNWVSEPERDLEEGIILLLLVLVVVPQEQQTLTPVYHLLK